MNSINNNNLGNVIIWFSGLPLVFKLSIILGGGIILMWLILKICNHYFVIPEML